MNTRRYFNRFQSDPVQSSRAPSREMSGVSWGTVRVLAIMSPNAKRDGLGTAFR